MFFLINCTDRPPNYIFICSLICVVFCCILVPYVLIDLYFTSYLYNKNLFLGLPHELVLNFVLEHLKMSLI